MSKILIIEDISDLRERAGVYTGGYEAAQARTLCDMKRCSRRRRGICCCSIAICRMAWLLWQEGCATCVRRQCSC